MSPNGPNAGFSLFFFLLLSLPFSSICIRLSGDAKVFRWKTIFFPPPMCLRASLFILPKCGGGSSTITCYSFFPFFFKRLFLETNLSLFFLRKTVKSKVRRGEIPPSRIRSLSTYIINLCISSPNGQKEDLALQRVGTVRFTRLERREQGNEKDVHSARLAATNPRE